jgi:hypothetical protein
MSRRRKPLFGDETGVIRDCLIACSVGLVLFVIATIAFMMNR